MEHRQPNNVILARFKPESRIPGVSFRHEWDRSCKADGLG